jgi:hypothetical protein
MPLYARAGTLVPTYPDGVMTLAHGSPAVPDETLVGDDRVVYAFLGESGSFSEVSGLAYELTALGTGTGALTAGWSGKPLAACAAMPVAPCFAASADGGRAFVTGPGTLEISAGGAPIAKLAVTGGKAERRLTLALRR